MDQSKLSLG